MSALDPRERKERLKQLGKINNVARAISNRRASPRVSETLLFSVIATFGGGLLTRSVPLTMAICVCSLVAFYLLLRNRPKSWVSMLDDLLTDYSPVDSAAYERLQQLTEDAGSLIPENVHEWTYLEAFAISGPAPRESDSLRFIAERNKKA